jgi:hypothetical protein
VEGGPVSGKAGKARVCDNRDLSRKSESMQAPFCAALSLCLKSVGLPAIGGQNGPEHVSRNESACTVRYLVLFREAGMLADDIADRIATACPGELDWIIRDMWVDHTHGLLADGRFTMFRQCEVDAPQGGVVFLHRRRRI